MTDASSAQKTLLAYNGALYVLPRCLTDVIESAMEAPDGTFDADVNSYSPKCPM